MLHLPPIYDKMIFENQNQKHLFFCLAEQDNLQRL